MLRRDIAVGCFVHKRSFSNVNFIMKIINKRDVFSYALSIINQAFVFMKKKESFSLQFSASLHYENSNLNRKKGLNGTQNFVIHITCTTVIG